MFNFKDIPGVQEAERIEKNGIRLYRTPHNKEYDSITTILSSTDEKDLSGWKQFEGQKALSSKKLLKELRGIWYKSRQEQH